MGLFVQFLCGYVTLPLYALVIQMGSSRRETIFTERIKKGLKHWQRLARKNLQIHQSNSSGSQHLPPENTENFILEDDSSHKPSLQELVSTHDEIHPEETLFRELPSKEEDDHNFNNENKITEIEEESSTNIHRGLVMETESVGGLMSTSTSTGHNGGELSFRTFTQEGGHENKMEVPEFYEKNDQV